MIKLISKLAFLFIAIIAAGVLWQRAQLSALALTRIDPVPETRQLVDQERYAEAADYLGFFMDYPYVQANPAAQALQQEIETVRGSLSYQASKLGEGLLAGTSDETVGQAAGVVTDLFVIGDLRDLTKQGINWARGEETDEVVAALATIGVVATAAQVVSGVATVGTAGAAAPSVAATTAVKGGTTILKAARKLGKLPPWLGKALVKSAKTVKQTRSLDSVAELFGNVYKLAKTRGGMQLLSKTRDAASLKRMAAFAETFGQHSATLYRIGGDTVLKTARRAGELSQDTIKLAATYGKQGLRTLDKMGALKFTKYTARASKIAVKGDLMRLIARWLLQLPTWALYAIVGLGIAVWVPWQRLRRGSRHWTVVTPGMQQA
ncbi:hypothetical protein G3480_25050 [Thiorhodococcus mannitoliphagus]|uniref:Uncharacterized protein n=1 Tax=Thiorhodococcus mannitoliphagus TaxID=329406 RepID=A0A6P1E0S8_9GAMM|nr:hypothetical protein [Thiorhodococcus mannitoliphagus]NEX23509.1 hypothetical protein [Thiorhodococcus mannitoliphagus]